MIRKTLLPGCLSYLGLVLLSGCYHDRDVYTGPPPQRVVYVEGAPPPRDYVEVVPVRPWPGAVWYPGHWQRHGRHWIWHNGHWH